MKVLYFHQHFSTPQGSSGTRSYEFARRLAARGHDVTVVCGSYALARTGLSGETTRGVRRGVVDGIEVIEIELNCSNYDGLWKRSVTFLRYAWASVRIAWRERYDLLFATSTPLTASLPGIAMRLLKPTRKFVFEVRDLWPELPKAMGVIRNPLILIGLSVLERASYAAMHAGVALSPGIERGMRSRAGSGKEIALVPNGCDLDTFQPTTEGDRVASSDGTKNGGRGVEFLPEVPPGSFCCVFTGAHGIANGLDAVLDAARVLKAKKRDDIQLVFVGDGKLKPRLIDRCRAEQLSNCHFLDPMPKVKLATLMAQAQVGLMILANVPAFYYGTSPNKFFDYIATGLPVLNNYPGWLSELIMEHKCGIAVAPDDAEAFAESLIWLADHPEDRARMAENARDLAESSFSREMLADRFVDLIEAVGTPGAACAEDEAGQPCIATETSTKAD